MHKMSDLSLLLMGVWKHWLTMCDAV